MTRFALYINKNSKAPLYAIQCCLFPAGVCFNPPAPFLKGEPTGRWPTGRRLFRRKFYAALRRVASRFPLCKGGQGGFNDPLRAKYQQGFNDPLRAKYQQGFNDPLRAKY